MLPYQDFFYTVDLPDRASPAEIRRACPRTVGRRVVFKRFYDAHPDDVRYLLGYLDAYTRDGVYDDQQYRHCYDLIAQGLALADRSGAHRKLHKLQRDLEQQHAAILAECGPDPPADGESPRALFLAGRYDALLSQFTLLQKEVTPVGISRTARGEGLLEPLPVHDPHSLRAGSTKRGSLTSPRLRDGTHCCRAHTDA